MSCTRFRQRVLTLGLTYYPFISPDGQQIAYGNGDGESYVIGTAGGLPRKILAKDSFAANWSPDGNLLVFTDTHDAARPQLGMVDLRTGAISVVPEPQGLIGEQWVAERLLVASRLTPVIFDLDTKKWSELATGTAILSFVNWLQSPDYKYLRRDGRRGARSPAHPTGRPQGGNHRQLEGPAPGERPDGNTQIGVSPDGSPVFTRDMGTQEVYALTVEWP
jgi:hypothetical protein